MGQNGFYFFIDDFIRKACVYVLTEKSEAINTFKNFINQVEKETEKFIKVLRTDKGGDYCPNEFDNYCNSMKL